jgi:hypothetical protein
MPDRDLTDLYEWTDADEAALNERHRARSEERLRHAIEGTKPFRSHAKARARYYATTHGLNPNTKPHARTARCPICFEPLIVVNLNETTARKGCQSCKRKFDYTRTDTPEGRAKRVKEWRDNKNARESA